MVKLSLSTPAGQPRHSPFSFLSLALPHRCHVPGAKRLAEKGHVPMEVVGDEFSSSNAVRPAMYRPRRDASVAGGPHGHAVSPLAPSLQGILTHVVALLGNGQYVKGYQQLDEALTLGATIVGVGASASSLRLPFLFTLVSGHARARTLTLEALCIDAAGEVSLRDGVLTLRQMNGKPFVMTLLPFADYVEK